MSTIYQCDKCGAQSSDAGSIAKVDLVDLCKQCRTAWSEIKGMHMKEFLASTPEQTIKKAESKRRTKTEVN